MALFILPRHSCRLTSTRHWTVHPVASQLTLTPPLPPLSPPPPRRQFSRSIYDTLFSPSPPGPSVWNYAISCSQWYWTLLPDIAGLPSLGWSVVLGTFLLRTVVTFPLQVVGEINQDRLETLYDDIEKSGIKRRMIREIEEKATKKGSAEVRKKLATKKAKEALLNSQRRKMMKKFYVERNCHPGKKFAQVVIQIPLWFVSSIALRNMTGFYFVDGAWIQPTCPQIMGQQFLWISDLGLPDASGLTSLFLGLTYLTLIEINVYKEYKGVPMPRRGRILVNVFRLFGLVVMPGFGAVVPAAVSVYWLASGLAGLAHNIVMMTPSVRRAFGIISRASPYDEPFKDIWAGFKSYWKIKDRAP